MKTPRSIISKKTYLKNRDKILSYNKLHYQQNKATICAKAKEYRAKNKDIIALKKKKYAQEHRVQIAEYRRNKLKTDVQFRLACLLRKRIARALTSNKAGSAVKDLGCSVSELKFFIEGKFKDSMTWVNQGKWEIDHVIPLAFFDLTNREQFLKANHYTNLQPMWAPDNRKKSKSYPQQPQQAMQPIGGR